jgi:hypothetical protein
MAAVVVLPFDPAPDGCDGREQPNASIPQRSAANRIVIPMEKLYMVHPA